MLIKLPYFKDKTMRYRFIWQTAVLLALSIILSSGVGAKQSRNESTIRVAYFTQDPPSIDPLSPAFDPDSYAIITQIFDSLVYMDLDGNFKAGLATDWKQLSDTQWQFNLRKNVKFHNGESFNAKAVKFTFDYLLNPANKAGNRWIFSSLKSVNFDKNQPYVVTFETLYPDGMFLNRLNMFGSICPPDYIKKFGFEHFQKVPVGTGPYQFYQWKNNSSISLKKNQAYWQEGTPHIDNLVFNIIPEQQWPEAFKNKQLDFIPNLSGSKTSELMRLSEGQARIIKRPVLISYWVMLRNQGVLADLNIRKAINHAVNKADIVKYADFGNAIPMTSLGKQGEFGAHPDLKFYQYDPALAKQLINQAGVTTPIYLKVLVSDIAEKTARIIQANLKAVDIHLQLEIVSRSEWSNLVVGHKIVTGKRADYDMVINLVDNPIYNLAFHAGLFLQSDSPWSLLESKEFDEKFAQALMVTDPTEHRVRLESLDQYIHQQALLLFTTQKIITAAVRVNFDIKKFGASGHLDYEVLSTAKTVTTP